MIHMFSTRAPFFYFLLVHICISYYIYYSLEADVYHLLCAVG
jgi:hypothetical protein